jgi:hypothetical protein
MRGNAVARHVCPLATGNPARVVVDRRTWPHIVFWFGIDLHHGFFGDRWGPTSRKRLISLGFLCRFKARNRTFCGLSSGKIRRMMQNKRQ